MREKNNIPFDFSPVTEKPLGYDEDEPLPIVRLEEADIPSAWKEYDIVRPHNSRKKLKK